MTATAPAPTVTRDRLTGDYDVAVTGAGFAGMYLLHRLRSAGLRAVVFERGTGVGGTWYWNRYPGARCDVQSIEYSYSFDPDLEQEWTWSEKFATQPEILRYANHVADRFDLRRDICFTTRVTSARWDDAGRHWQLGTDAGDAITARFYVMASGCLSAAKDPEIPGADRFAGATYHTGRWPHEGVDFTGKRVAVIGTGSSGIQSIPVIAAQAAQLTVFQRTPNFSVPARNRELEQAEIDDAKARYPELREYMRHSRGGQLREMLDKSAFDVTPAERAARYAQGWEAGVTDLYAGGFDPCEGSHHYAGVDPAALDAIHRHKCGIDRVAKAAHHHEIGNGEFLVRLAARRIALHRAVARRDVFVDGFDAPELVAGFAFERNQFTRLDWQLGQA